MNRIQHIYGRYGWRTPFVILAIVVIRSGKILSLFRLFWLRLTTYGSKGQNILLGSDIEITPGSHLKLGSNTFIGTRCIFEITVEPPGQISIGDNSWISHDCHLTSMRYIEIGSYVSIGEFVSIRDSTHSHKITNIPIRAQKDKVGTIIIQDDVWIGRGCLIQGRPEGITIGKGTIIAANSMVNCSIPDNQIWGGNPAHYIKSRHN